MNKEIALVSGRANPELANQISKELNIPLSKVDIKQFKDGEIQVYYNETIRGKHVFIIQPTFSPSDNIIELLIMIDAARRASAASIISVNPYFGYARQDRKDRPRTSIGAKLMANLYTTAGIDRLITLDLHQDQIQGFFEIPVDHLYSSAVFIPYLTELNIQDLCIVSPDTGGTKRASAYAKFLNCDLAIGYKQREQANEVSKLQIIGDVKDKNVVIVDDIIDTGGTLCKAAAEAKAMGAKSVIAMCPHALLSGNGIENIENSVIEELVITDSIPFRRECSKIKTISIAPFLAQVIESVMDRTSISSHYDLNNS
ncbi:ribose-phosphate pyrophosphokinase [Bacteroidales bacterium OttesenSCG-928-B11]|nr:ribose-phosphate pyrophosphokinase [Bacteroidales bacterium OttesenSCG-928-E04]MDL2312486.1 ribose-phosphate pyrophosphokinase [Bacteroidales bacterium OttesenSCG-928-B11]MDL2325717.1 ribose-phosphate pyrophosphokinase [Bacteroidales bacterium OttesenSCG-928-A14]